LNQLNQWQFERQQARLALPIFRDVTEQSMLHFVPFGSASREV